MCVRLKEPKPANPAKLSKRWKHFGDMVAVDLFTLADRTFLNMVGHASGYQCVAPVNSKRPDEVFKVFNRVWMNPLGIPYNVVADNGG